MPTMGEKMEASAIAVTNVSVTSLVTNNDSSSRPLLPCITTSQSPEYCHRLAEIISRATLADPLNIIFEQEKTGELTTITPGSLYVSAERRIATKTAAGGFVVEAGNFAAVACWEPPSSNAKPFTEAQIQELAKDRPMFAQFIRDNDAGILSTFGRLDQPQWKLSLMARDPERKDKGAVRAVIEPYIKKAKEEKMPLWLVAGNPRARDVYAYFGFRVVKVIHSYPKVAGGYKEVLTWCMVCNWPVQ